MAGSRKFVAFVLVVAFAGCAALVQPTDDSPVHTALNIAGEDTQSQTAAVDTAVKITAEDVEEARRKHALKTIEKLKLFKDPEVAYAEKYLLKEEAEPKEADAKILAAKIHAEKYLLKEEAEPKEADAKILAAKMDPEVAYAEKKETQADASMVEKVPKDDVAKDPEVAYAEKNLLKEEAEPNEADAKMVAAYNLHEKESKPAVDAAPAAAVAEDAAPVAKQVAPQKNLDINSQIVAYPTAAEPFGQETPAKELTKQSVKQSDSMVDKMENAQGTESKRAVYRALTKLRGATVASYDGIAKGNLGNVDKYNAAHKWRDLHPMQHLAQEEADTKIWAFPKRTNKKSKPAEKSKPAKK